ncbi:MAG: hypothetical protein JW876_04190 [Candidatus Krumholzibacteriota bacterium]|nr:hypothetical protein [Candidatus Krumholzibacteriota bacterium]
MTRSHRHAAWGIILVVLGVILLLDAFRIFDFWWTFWKLWPLLLVWWGIRLIRRERRGDSAAAFEAFGDRTVNVTEETISQEGIFGDIRVTAASEVFRGGSVSNVFGDVLVDLDGVVRVEGEARLLVKCVFGDIRVRLPRGAEYTIEGKSSFGHTAAPDGQRLHGRAYASPGFDAAPDRIRLTVSCVFGDVDVMQ